MYKNFLIFDFGASNGRVIIAFYDGNKFSFELLYRFDNIPVYATGALYWDFLKLFSELKKGLLITFRKFGKIESLGIDTWGLDFGIIDKNGKLISNPIHYRDKIRNSMIDEVYKIIPMKELFNLTGCNDLSLYSLFNLYALKILNSTEYTNANKFLMMPDLFNYFLTGNTFNEYTIAHSTQMLNIFSKKWEFNKIIDRLGFNRNLFCKIIQSGTIVGKIQGSICKELDISQVPVIATVSHDTPSAIAGIPVIDKSKNKVFISLGTWGVIIKDMDEPLINTQVYKSGFMHMAGVNSILLCKTFVGMWLIQQCHDSWTKNEGKDISWDDIMNMVKITNSINSFIDVDKSNFVLLQSDMPKIIRQFCKDTKQKVPNSMGEIARVIYESIVLKIRYNFEILKNLIGTKFDLIHLVGGGTKDELLCQWITDALGLTLHSGPTETASVGNLIMQLKALEEIKNLDEGRQIHFNSVTMKQYIPKSTGYWNDLYEKYLKIL